MSRFRWPLLVLIICAPVAVLATGVRLPFLDTPTTGPQPQPVPDGDRELVWLHTTTNGTTWERFVTGVARAPMHVPGLIVDDSAAFSDKSTAVPEVVLSMNDRPGKLRIRWYKLTGDATTTQWIQAFAQRDPPPLAIIGGGSSDRAFDLAKALDRQTEWQGERPILFITTATADEVAPDSDDAKSPATSRNLIDVYDQRSFRFCFTNRQMAEAVLDFVWENPGLRPITFAELARLGVLSGLAAQPSTRQPAAEQPSVFSTVWQDDPFSIDLHRQFTSLLDGKLSPHVNGAPGRIQKWEIPYSVGSFTRPNQYETLTVESMVSEFQKLPPQRSLLVLPTITHPARRVLRTLSESLPGLGQRLVAVTGDGIPVNALYRDGEFSWPVHAIPVPLVLFSHENPIAWDEPNANPAPPPGYGLRPPTSTEDVLLFTVMTRFIVRGCCGKPDSTDALPTADALNARMHEMNPRIFDANGDRLGGSGEYIVVLWPKGTEGSSGQTPQHATLEVWRRRPDRGWDLVRTVAFDQRRNRLAAPPDRPEPRTSGGPDE